MSHVGPSDTEGHLWVLIESTDKPEITVNRGDLLFLLEQVAAYRTTINRYHDKEICPNHPKREG